MHGDTMNVVRGDWRLWNMGARESTASSCLKNFFLMTRNNTCILTGEKLGD